MKSTLSVVIPTFNRSQSLTKTLDSIAASAKPSEIIIVEQEQNNRNIIEKHYNYLKLPAQYIFLKLRSVTKALNIGIAKARGEIILLLDDDVIVDPAIFKNHVKNYSNKDIGAVCGRVITAGEKTFPHSTNVGKISGLGTFTDDFSSTIRQDIDSPIGCNLSFRKNIFTRLGGFDERFTQNAIRFEADFSLRVKSLGYRVVFDPNAAVTHVRTASGGTRMNTGRSEWYRHFFSNELYFFLKHKRHIYLPLFILSRIYWVIRCVARVYKEKKLIYIMIPFFGLANGITKYKQFLYEIASQSKTEAESESR